MTKMAAQTDNKSIETKINATTIQQSRIRANEERNVMYCSQKMKGIPVNIEKKKDYIIELSKNEKERDEGIILPEG